MSKLINRINAIFVTNEDLRDINISEDMSFLKSLKEPKNDAERSFSQYQCQKRKYKKKSIFLARVISIIMYIPLILFFLLGSLKKRKRNYQCSVFWNSLEIDIIPISLQEKYKPCIILENELGFLKIKDVRFLFKIIKQIGFYPDFHFKIMMRISYYRKLIEKYNPKCIIATAEYSYTSSILTEYCEINNIKHINVMHGEKVFNIRDSFFRFTNCYIWDEHYEKLFTNLRAEKEQFVIELPPSMKIELQNYQIKNMSIIDYKFYLDILDEESAKKLKSYCEILIKSGASVLIRPHPKYTDKNLLYKYFPYNMIEDNNIDIAYSICSTRYVISKASTVLNQAYHVGRNIIIDDLTDYKAFLNLKKIDYIIFSYRHSLLSDMLNNIKLNN